MVVAEVHAHSRPAQCVHNKCNRNRLIFQRCFRPWNAKLMYRTEKWAAWHFGRKTDFSLSFEWERNKGQAEQILTRRKSIWNRNANKLQWQLKQVAQDELFERKSATIQFRVAARMCVHFSCGRWNSLKRIKRSIVASCTRKTNELTNMHGIHNYFPHFVHFDSLVTATIPQNVCLPPIKSNA